MQLHANLRSTRVFSLSLYNNLFNFVSLQNINFNFLFFEFTFYCFLLSSAPNFVNDFLFVFLLIYTVLAFSVSLLSLPLFSHFFADRLIFSLFDFILFVCSLHFCLFVCLSVCLSVFFFSFQRVVSFLLPVESLLPSDSLQSN